MAEENSNTTTEVDDVAQTLKDIKTVVGINDELQDSKINVIIKMTQQQLLVMIKADKVPESLKFIVYSVSLARYNRIGNEGQRSFSQEGENISWPLDDFDPYKSVINNQIRESQRGHIITG